MVSVLLDELPCLLDEADELMARFSWYMTLLKIQPKGATTAIPVDEVSATTEDVVFHLSKEDLKESLSPRPRSPSSPSAGKNQNMVELRPVLDSIDLNPIVKLFARQFLTMQSMSIDKINANLPAGESGRNALYTIATSIHQLMKRLHHWQQAAWESLTRFFADNSRSDSCLLTFDSHPQLTRLVLATVAKYVKVNLLWTSFSVIPGLLSLYNFLRYTQTAQRESTPAVGAVYSPLEHTDHRVREFVLHFGSAPLLAIQQDYQQQVADRGAAIAALALSCFERYEACRDLAKLRHQGVFDLESLVSGAYASHSCLPDLIDAMDIADWVICTVLCVPHQLQGTDRTASMSPRSGSSSPTNSPSVLQLWGFMEIITRDRLVLTLHRNHVVNLHDLLYQQVTSSLSASALTAGPPPSSTRPSFGNNRSTMALKKTMNVIGKFALRNSGANHRQRREVALWLVQNCVQLVKHNPGLVAPTFPLLLAALAIARDEFEWAMCHSVRSANTESYKTPLLPSHVKTKHLQRVVASFSACETELPELLASCHQLRGLIEQNSHFLAEYYQVYLGNGDAEGIAYSIQELFAAIDSTPSRSEMQPLLEGFLDAERYRVNTSSSPRATWVREWRQANAHLAAGAQLPLLDALRARMECAVRHTQYICSTSELLEHTANFSKCWWFRDVVFERCFGQTLAASPSSPIGLLAILSRLSAGDYSLEELVDTEEAAQQSKKMQQLMNRMRTSLVNQVELGLEAVVKQDVNLQQDESSGNLQCEEKPERVENKLTASSRRLSSFSLVQSSQVQRPSNAELRLASPTSFVLSSNYDSNSVSVADVKSEHIGLEERCLGLVRALLDHIKQHGRGTIVKTAMVDRVQSCFTRFVRGFVVYSSTGSADGIQLRCSFGDACVQVRCFLRATQRLFGCDSNELDEINEVSLGEAIQAELAKVLAAECSVSESVLPQDKRLLEWITGSPCISEREFEQWSLMDRFSWLYVSLVARRCHPSPPSSAALSFPPVLAAVRKSCFVLASGVSGELDPRDYTDPEALRHLVTLIGLTGVESVCSTIANLVVAQTLKLRSSIEAEYAVLAFMDMALSGGTEVDVVLASAQVRALDDIATQLVQIGTTAFLLQLLHGHSPHATTDAWEARVAPQILCELQQDPDRRATWTRMLPVACSSGFHSSVWKRTTYLPSVEATDTNAHMMGLAMARLLPSPHNSQAVHQCAVAALRRTAACTSGTTQTSISKSKTQRQNDTETTTRPLLEALELLVTTTSSVNSEATGPHGSALGELELAVERLLPRAALVLHSAA